MKLCIEYLNNYDKNWGELAYKHTDDSGFDLRAAITEPIILHPGEYRLIDNGIKIEFQGPFPLSDDFIYEIQVRPRSGLAAKYGICVTNTPGTVDFGYRGELKTNLVNLGKEDFIINPGDRIAQAVVCPVLKAVLATVETVNTETTRGAGGFGSTGQK
ncbi:MAG: dUTP diphosphatase [Alphaproteobacteria bacterium]|nr:dUTP diphosphatase [Alphaproteobacteria bacterium]